MFVWIVPVIQVMLRKSESLRVEIRSMTTNDTEDWCNYHSLERPYFLLMLVSYIFRGLPSHIGNQSDR